MPCAVLRICTWGSPEGSHVLNHERRAGRQRSPESESPQPKPVDAHARARGNAWGDRLRALKNVPPVLHFVWESGPAVVFWNITIRIVVAFLPVGIGIIGRYIIDGVNRIRLHQPLARELLVAGGRRDGACRADRHPLARRLTTSTTFSPIAIRITSALR